MAATVPPVIYSIPPSSPLHYVTYVYVYRATPQVVYVGYTPGYYSVYVSERRRGLRHRVLLHLVGRHGLVRHARHLRVRHRPTYTPWTGWVMGFGFGLAFGVATAGWGWGSYPWWGPYHYG